MKLFFGPIIFFAVLLFHSTASVSNPWICWLNQAMAGTGLRYLMEESEITRRRGTGSGFAGFERSKPTDVPSRGYLAFSQESSPSGRWMALARRNPAARSFSVAG